MADYRKVALRRFARNRVRETPEARFWRKFKNPKTIEYGEAVSCVAFSPVRPYDYAVTTSTRIVLLSGGTDEQLRAFSRFTNVAYSGTFRRDGKLIVAGAEDSKVRVFEAASRTVLRVFEGHSAAVHVTRFPSWELTRVLSGSDDKTTRVWDIPTQQSVAVLAGHADYVRCGADNPGMPDTWISGSYDHTVRLWDLRTHECTVSMDHGAPIFDAIVLPGGNLVVSAGGQELKVWDIPAGGRLVHTFSNHHKAITCLGLDSSASRLLSGSLDHHVKFYDVSTFEVTHSIKFDHPILSLALSADNRILAVGMTNGSLCVRRREAQDQEPDRREQEAKLVRGGTHRHFRRGQSAKPEPQDHVVFAGQKRKLQPYDIFLRKFQYHDALNAAIMTGHAVVVVSVIDELIQRKALRLALQGREPQHLAPLLKFLVRYITNPYYSSVLVDVAAIVCELYTPMLGRSAVIDELFLRLQTRIRQELDFQKQLFVMQGTLGLLTALAAEEPASDCVIVHAPMKE